MRFHQNISKRKTKDGYYYDIDKCGALCEDEVEIVQYLHPDMRRRRMTCKTDKETIQKSNKMLLEAFFADPTCRDKSKIIIGVSWLDKNNSLITGVADNFESPNSNTFVLSSLIAKLYSTRQGDEMKR
ncbi:MAG: hypothetical protein KKF44_02310 [Nanoarchaeota archaeon]|nr:hypothetical protein [Nanoarchaeota archaeon]